MKRHVYFLPVLAVVLSAQTPPRTSDVEVPAGGVPLYNVNVVARTTKAVNYHHRSVPTKIGFEGTVLMPDARGEAKVEGKKGAMRVDAKFKDLQPPTRFGAQYLTYVLWAITPQGRAINLGEVLTNHDHQGKLQATAELQAFALVVTAEPYYAVTEPSDVVVLENVILPETMGKVQTVDAKFELLKRGTYTYDKSRADTVQPEGKKISLDRYEALLEVYQAMNAVQLAKAQGADQMAAASYEKAERLLREAESQYAAKQKSRVVVATAREATQTAEDARLITQRKKEQQSTLPQAQ